MKYCKSEKQNAISGAYRNVHPSHLGRVDIDSSSNSDPGISGTICPLAELYDGHFSEYTEPSTWNDNMVKVLDVYRASRSKVEMYRLLDDKELVKQKSNIREIMQDEVVAARNLLSVELYATYEEYYNGFDIFGDDRFFWLRE